VSGPWHPTGRARVNARSPSAHGICDRCGFRYNRVDLRAQQQWNGLKLQTYNILVCKRCLDAPQIQLRTIIIPADPPPVLNPRPEQYSTIVPSYMATLANQRFVTASGVHLTMMIRVTPVSLPPPQAGYLSP
jgi:hypothetical protein